MSQPLLRNYEHARELSWRKAKAQLSEIGVGLTRTKDGYEVRLHRTETPYFARDLSSALDLGWEIEQMRHI